MVCRNISKRYFDGYTLEFDVLILFALLFTIMNSFFGIYFGDSIKPTIQQSGPSLNSLRSLQYNNLLVAEITAAVTVLAELIVDNFSNRDQIFRKKYSLLNLVLMLVFVSSTVVLFVYVVQSSNLLMLIVLHRIRGVWIFCGLYWYACYYGSDVCKPHWNFIAVIAGFSCIQLRIIQLMLRLPISTYKLLDILVTCLNVLFTVIVLIQLIIWYAYIWRRVKSGITVCSEHWKCATCLTLMFISILLLYIGQGIIDRATSLSTMSLINFFSIEFAHIFFFMCCALYRTRDTRQEFVKYEAELEFKRMFVRYISHEIRTPLNTAIMGLQVLTQSLNTYNDHDNLEVVQDISKSCDIAVNILNELLTFDKLQSGTLLIEKSRVNAMSLVEETVRPFQIQARQANISLSISVHPDNSLDLSTAFINVDSNKMQQVIRNLVSNGLKFTPPGGSVSVTVCVVEGVVSLGDGNTPTQLKIEVVDTGVGISLENQKRLFNEIVQFNPGKLQKGGGSGLGLFISSGIVKLHDGVLSVHCDGEGAGSTFALTLPVDSAQSETPIGDAVGRFEAANIATVAGSRRESIDIVNIGSALGYEVYVSCDSERQCQVSMIRSETSPAGGDVHDLDALRASLSLSLDRDSDALDVLAERKDDDVPGSSDAIYGMDQWRSLNILLVDDSSTSRKMQRRLLQGRCKSCTELEDGLQAVELIGQMMAAGDPGLVPIDLIMIDSNMPVMGGLEATNIIREMGYTGFIFGVTGNVSAEDIAAFLSQGADAVLPKPLKLQNYDYAVNHIIFPN